MTEFNRNPERLTWGGVGVGLFLVAVGISLRVTSGALCLLPGIVAAAVLTVVTFLSALRLYFQRRRLEEEENLELYRREHPETELFADSDEALRLAARGERLYKSYALPLLTLSIGVLLIAFTLLRWQAWNSLSILPQIDQPLAFAILSITLFLGALLIGSFYLGASRDPGYRWVRPTAGWMFLTGILFLLSGVVLVVYHLGLEWPRLDIRMARLGLLMLLLLGAELVISVIIDFYRPRGQQKEVPVLESRLLALFTEPGGIARNIALSLDYQFGFKVSEAGFYRFFERMIVPFAMVMLIGFWLMSTLTVVRVEENGIRERFGRVVSPTPLGPGLYFKLPWPLASIYKFPVERVQELPIGYTPGRAGENPDLPPEEMGDLSGRVIVWSKMHNLAEENFVVASRSVAELAPDGRATPAPDDSARGGKVPVSAYFMSASVPLYFKVENLYDFAYRHSNPRQTLTDLAQRELVRYLATVDLFELLTRKREEGAQVLRERIQAAANDVQLGIAVVFIGLEGIHPPVRVGQYFDEVVSASEEKHTMALEGQKYATGKVPEALAQAYRLVSEAEAYKFNKQQMAAAEAARFTKQLLSYEIAPDIFVLRSYLELLEEKTAGIRKYVVAVENGQETIIINLEEKLRPDLLDIDLDRNE